MSELNYTGNLTLPLVNETANATNETIKQTINNGGSFAVDKLFNMDWATGVSAWLVQFTGQTFITPQLVGLVLPLVSLFLLYWKWGAIMNFIENLGKYIIILIGVYLAAKAFGVL